VLAPEQFNTCKADITFRRLQNFHPVQGDVIKWKNIDASGSSIQTGSFTFNGGLITIKNLTVNKSGNKIDLKITNCERDAESTFESSDPEMFFTLSGNGYTAHVNVTADQNSFIYVYDLMGRVMMNKEVYLQAGSNDFEISAIGTGIFIVEIRGSSFSDTKKLFF
jgi:hypothetical protein